MDENLNMDNTYTLSKEYDNLESIQSKFYKEKLTGGHKIKIIKVEKYTNPKSGNKSIKIYYDFADGLSTDGCMLREFRKKKEMFDEVYYPIEGTTFLSTKPEFEIYVKKLIKSAKSSNPNKTIIDIAGEPFDLNQLIDTYVGAEIGLEEFKKDDEITTRISLFKFMPVDKIDSVKETRVKLIDGKYISYNEYCQKYLNEDDNYSNYEEDNEYLDDDSNEETSNIPDVGFYEDEELPF